MIKPLSERRMVEYLDDFTFDDVEKLADQSGGLAWDKEHIADIIKYYNDGYFDLLIDEAYEVDGISYPWNTDIQLYGDKVIMTGNMTASGKGNCKCELSVDEFLDMFIMR